MVLKSVDPLMLPPNPASNAACPQHEPAFLYVSQAVKLDEKQRQQVTHIRAAHADLDLAYALTQAFVSMLAEHQDTALENRLAQAQHDRIKEPHTFAPCH